MLSSYQIQPNTRQCAATGRVLQPGDKYFSVLVEEKGRFIRQDFSSEAWQGPPPHAVGFWGGIVPEKSVVRKVRKDDDLLLEFLDRLDGEADSAKLNFRYVLALLLLRSRRLQFEEVRVEEGREFLLLRETRSGKRYEVFNPRLTEEALIAVQEEVLEVVGWN